MVNLGYFTRLEEDCSAYLAAVKKIKRRPLSQRQHNLTIGTKMGNIVISVYCYAEICSMAVRNNPDPQRNEVFVDPELFYQGKILKWEEVLDRVSRFLDVKVAAEVLNS